MIAELFYPKELKDVIADLRAKDDLKDNATKYIDREWIGNTIIVFVFAFAIGFSGRVSPWICLIVGFCAWFIIVRLHYASITKRYILPYSVGFPYLAEIVSSVHDGWYEPNKGHWLKYKFTADGNTHYGTAERVRKPIQSVKVGDYITVYLDKNTQSSAAYLEERNQNHCLRKSKLGVSAG